jgi:hypothetical protein
VFLQQFQNATPLPWGQTAFDLRDSFTELAIPPDKMRTNHHRERIHKQLREHLRPA